jgi:molybdate transport system substrate-binding protein
MSVQYLVICLIVLSTLSGRAQVKNESALIAAASDLKFALDSIIAVYKNTHGGMKIDVVYGSSGKLYEQIVNSAPFDIFFSADIGYPQKLSEKGLILSAVKTYGFGKIVLWSKKGNPSKEKMNLLLKDDVKKIAIANPLHAPYGRSAEQALKYYGNYDKIKKKLVFGENISQTAQFVTSGAADAGIIALSLALSPAMQNLGGKYFIIPQESYQALEQGYVTLKHGKDNGAVRNLDEFIERETSKKILQYFGFSTK